MRLLVLFVAAACAWHFALRPAWAAAVARADAAAATDTLERAESIEAGRLATFDVVLAAEQSVEVDVDVRSGPAVDVRVLDMPAFGAWQRAGGHRGAAPRSLVFAGPSPTRSFRGETRLPVGTYVVVVDNTSRGDTADVTCAVRTR